MPRTVCYTSTFKWFLFRMMCLCLSTLFPHPKHLWHSWQLYLLVCIFMWRPTALWDEKRLAHLEHEYQFPPVCEVSCSVKVCFHENRLLHMEHTNGFSFASSSSPWILLWSTRCLCLVNWSPQSVHLNSFSLVNDFVCAPWDDSDFQNIFHSFCTHTELCGYSYADKGQPDMNDIPYTDCMSTDLLQRVIFYRHWNCLSLIFVVHKNGLGMSLCGCLLWSLLAASVFTVNKFSPEKYAQHWTVQQQKQPI